MALDMEAAELLEELASPVLLQLSNTVLLSERTELSFFYKVAPASKAVLTGACCYILTFLLIVACCGVPRRILKERKVCDDSGMPYSMLLALSLTMFLDHYSTDQYQTSMPNMAKEFGVSQMEMGLSVLVHLFSSAVFILILGPLSDRLGRRPVILGSQALLVVSTLGCGCADSFFWFMVGRAVQGAAAAVYCPVLAAVRDCYQEEARRTTVMGLVFAVATLGPLIAPVLGGLTAAWCGWRYSFFSVAMGALLVNILSFLVVRESAPPYEDDGDHCIHSCIRVLSNRRRLLIIVCLGGFKSFFDLIAASGGFILVWQYGLSNVAASMLSSLIAIAGILGLTLSASTGWTMPTDIICLYAPFVLLAAIAMLLAGVFFHASMGCYIASICFAQLMLYPPVSALVSDFLEDVQDIAGLAAGLQTSGAQFISTLIALPGLAAASHGETSMLQVLAASLVVTQALVWLGLVPVGLWSSQSK
mmetsp:Transcript_36084/g.83103  ORF Transcript_36084/g.83103 Transcript_36084/m.83103 type:complete len:476 (-) Transcript_36084:26-1453(-)